MSAQPRRYTPSWVIAFLVWMMIGVAVFQRSNGSMFVWDSFGYHLYLSAILHDDPFLKDLAWVNETLKAQDASGTLYQVSTMSDGQHVIKYPMGLALVWGPWFMLGDTVARSTGAPRDGFSLPYERAVRIGIWVYVLFGLLALRSVLLRVFDEWTTAWTLVLLFLATNLLDQATAGFAMPHLPLFCLYAGILWATVRWAQERQVGRAVVLALFIGLAMLVRPSEGLALFLPLLWRNNKEVANPFVRAWHLRGQWAIIALVILLVGTPQFLYWKIATGHWVIDTYNNPGEGFDWLTPHVGSFLFSFRKGWYIYTPLMLLVTVGLWSLRGLWRGAFVPVLVFFVATVFALSSWTCWWFADSFGSRAMVGSYAVLALPLAALLAWTGRGEYLRRWGMSAIFAACAVLNGFQYWQFRKGIIDPSRMTKAAYMATFGRTSKPENHEDLLLIRRSITGEQVAPDTARYERSVLTQAMIELPEADTLVLDPTTGMLRSAYRITKEHQYTAAIRIPYSSLAATDHVCVEAEWQVLTIARSVKASFVSTMEHNGGSYGYSSENKEEKDFGPGVWTSVRTYYLTPEIRSRRDPFVCYFWLRDTVPVYVSGPVLTVHVPIDPD